MAEEHESLRCRGMRDLLPEDVRRLRAVEDAFRAACYSWRYEEIRTPTIEFLHLFTSAGTLSPQMLRRVYSFLDWDGWSGERVVLRPDATIPVARAYSEAYGREGVRRFCYMQNVFRFAAGDEPRENWQCGVELIGDTGRAGDLEMVMLAAEVLRALGIDGVRVRLSHAGLVRAVLAAAGYSPDEQSAMYDRLLDGDLSAAPEIESRLPGTSAGMRVLFEGEGEAGFLANLRALLQPAVPGVQVPLDELALLVEALTLSGIACRVTPVLARSFEYYSGPVFVFECDEQIVGRGGRYDKLIGLVSGEDTPASGFELDAGVLASMVRAGSGVEGPSVAVAAAGMSAEALSRAHMAAAELRRRGVRCEIAAGTTEAFDVVLDPAADGTARVSTKSGSRLFADLASAISAIEA